LVNGAEELLSHPDYVNAIEGMFKEEVYFTDTGEKQPVSETQFTVNKTVVLKRLRAG
jgi:cysteinyl-tRNA synthetase